MCGSYSVLELFVFSEASLFMD